MISLGIWWAVLAGIVLGVFLTGAFLSLIPLRRKRYDYRSHRPSENVEQFWARRETVRGIGKHTAVVALVLAALLTVLFVFSDEAPYIIEQLGKPFDKLAR